MDSASIPPTLYWRPGCPFCVHLRWRLHRAGAAVTEVNIWDEPAGAAVVRGITGGDETVPTLVVGDDTMVNPSPRRALAAIAAHGSPVGD